MGNDNRGQWQAQGNDIPGSGHAQPWNQPNAPTKPDAHAHLHAVAQCCSIDQMDVRKEAVRRAEVYIDRAPPEGIAAFHMKTFRVVSPPIKARKARVDLEITSGSALCDPSKDGTP